MTRGNLKETGLPTEGRAVGGGKMGGCRNGKPYPGPASLSEFPGPSQSFLRLSLSDVVGKVTGSRGRQLWAQVSAKSWPP